MNDKKILCCFLLAFMAAILFLGGRLIETRVWADEGKKSDDKIPELPPFEVPYDPSLPTKRVLVSPFENAVPGLNAELNAETALTAQLVTTLSKCKNFTVIDRAALQVLKDELTLSQAGAVTKQTAATPGQLLGTQIIIKGVITEFSEAVKGKSSGKKISIGTMAGVAGIFADTKALKTLDVVEAVNPEIGAGKEATVL